MKHLPVFLASVLLAISYSPSAQAAPITYQRLTELCRPQMEAIIPGSISYLEAQVAEWQQALRESPVDKDRGELIIREDEQKIASLRVDGIEGAAMRDMINPTLQARSNKTELRKALAEARSASGPDAALAVCIVSAVLANLEGTSHPQNAGAKSAAVPPHSVSKTVTGARPLTAPMPAPIPTSASVKSRAPRSKLKPTPHLSDDQKVFNAMLGLDKERQAARAACKAQADAESQRIDALEIVFDADSDGNPILRLHNNTDLQLTFEFDVGIQVGGVSRRGKWHGLDVLNPRVDTTYGNTEYNIVFDKGKPWAWQQLWNKRVRPTPLDYEACDRNN